MSRFLFAVWPLEGHLLPHLGIAAELRARGHEVAFYSGERARETLAREQMELFGFRDVDVSGPLARLQELDTSGRRTRPRGGRMIPVMREWLVDTLPAQVADLRRVLSRWPADVVVADPTMWGPIVVLWEADGVPVAIASILMGPLIPGPQAPPFGFGLPAPRSAAGRLGSALFTRVAELAAHGIWRAVDEVRAANGLGPLGESVNRFSARVPLHLVGNVRELDYGRHDLPESVRYVGNFSSYPRGDEHAELLDSIPTDKPWVYVTESTVAHGDPFMLRAAVEGLGGEPLELIVTTGERRAAPALGAARLPSNVHVSDWISHGELLPRCAATVNFGGKGTILAAAEAGVPMVVVPTGWDKPDNARRVLDAGAGLRLGPRRATARRLRAAVHELLSNPSYREAAGRLAAKLAAAPGAAGAAVLLERLAQEERRPAAAPTDGQAGASPGLAGGALAGGALAGGALAGGAPARGGVA
jgi:UDP:flavonoid glycosyltransferase YjiC (YdhE family)